MVSARSDSGLGPALHRFERRKVDKKKQTYTKTETGILYSRVF